jgi:hypothetical protein
MGKMTVMHLLVIEFIDPVYKVFCLNLQVGVIREVEPILGGLNPISRCR